MERLVAEVIESLPRTIHLALDMDAPEGVTIVFTAEIETEKEVSRVVFEASTPLGTAKYEIITAGDRM
ncbi:MAG: hypothetical protein OXG11_02205, partial [Chloroflexi bacterium]|nr:hypothetical protein [Chloroflexota bacterium]